MIRVPAGLVARNWLLSDDSGQLWVPVYAIPTQYRTFPSFSRLRSFLSVLKGNALGRSSGQQSRSHDHCQEHLWPSHLVTIITLMTELEAGDTKAQSRNVGSGDQASSLALPLPLLAGLGKAISSLQASVFPAVKWDNDIHMCQIHQQAWGSTE